ncbi:helix-turn-helix transcriptional regulator [Achromobacter sp.]|uniref:helix-turn-helix domain-containing protein n=1 Tax=Achromobacter sp. TaxID=134375 RepID=UPI002F945FC9
MTTFGSRFKAARQAVGLTQDALADLMGITKSAISAYENDRETPSFEKLQALREHLQISLDELVCGDEAKVRMEKQYAAIADGRAHYDVQELSQLEKRLVRAFRLLNDRQKKGMLDLLTWK